VLFFSAIQMCQCRMIELTKKEVMIGHKARKLAQNVEEFLYMVEKRSNVIQMFTSIKL
jgi:ribosomal protein S2